MEKTLTAKRLFALVAGPAVAVLVATPAWAAGSGYGPSSPPSQAIAAGFTAVVTAQTISASGGSVTGTANGATCVVTVPAGAFPNSGEVVISAGAPSSINAGTGKTVVTDFSVIVVDPDTGVLLSGSFASAITVTISHPAITSGDSVVNVTSPGVTSPVGAQVSQGQAVVSVTSDPNLAVIAGSSTTQTSTVTTGSGSLAFTGPGPGLFVLGMLGVGLALSGLLGLALKRARATS